MNLIETMKMCKMRIEDLEKTNADEMDIEITKKIFDWLDDLFKYRLMFSEIRNEFAHYDKIAISTQRLLNFLDDELKEWELDGKEYDE